MRSIFLLSFCFFFFTTFAQKSEFETSKVYYETKDENVDISVEGNELDITHSIFEKKHFNENTGIGNSTERIYQGSFSKVRNLKASTEFLNQDNKYKTKNIEKFELKSDFSGGSLYDDNTFYEVIYPNIQIGTNTVLSYTVDVTDPHFFKPFYFSEYLPVKSASYSITTEENIEIGWQLFGQQKDDVVFEKRNEEGKNIYTWKINNVKQFLQEKNSPGYLYMATHIVVYIKSYQVKDQTISVLKNVDDLFSWYQTLIDKIKPTNNGHLVYLTNQIIAGAENDTEKAKRIFHWVQDNIRYIAIEDGWRGFIPYPASEIFDKRYGDCKDMTHIMFEMMDIANVNAEHTWIGTRELPYKYEETPCASVDNHLILSVFIDGKVIILDATDSHTPFGIPTYSILGKEALFKANNQYQIYPIPEYSPEDCVITNEITIQANTNKITGSVTKHIETFEYSYFYNMYGNANVEKENFISDYLELGQNNFIRKNTKIIEEIPRVKTKFEYDFEIPTYITGFGNSSFINLNLTKPFSTETLKSDRKSNLEIDYKQQEINTVTFIIPEGKKVTQIPEKVNFSTDLGSCSATYVLEGNKIVYTRIISINKLMIQPSEFIQWNAFLKKVIEVYNTSIEYK